MNGRTSRTKIDRSGFHKIGPKKAGPAGRITLLPQQCLFIVKPACLGPTPLFKPWVAPYGPQVVTQIGAVALAVGLTGVSLSWQMRAAMGVCHPLGLFQSES